uniref:Eukaryotic translation initiation factor 3 subunit D n=1 Tax=Hemiselmis tepida TaxID=464990 RepID=A0A7S0YIB3_9CRYP|mmetsp:Transcript_11142/g.28950  ORF Transcript_11142/g.28950 Transcript_11142/m.28950 type:complete len:307 (+) Transcript_11142:513-1433(+)
MAAPRSVNSWDIVIQRVGGALYMDAREGCSLYETHVNETAVDAPDDEQKENPMNGMTALAAEAGDVNYCYTQQCLNKTQAPIPADVGPEDLRRAWGSMPPDVATPPQGKVYRYRKFALSDELTVVVRCEVDAAMQTRDDKLAYLTVKALNEFDSKLSGVDWRQKLESQRAAVIANELKNNRNKLTRWTCQALITGSDYLKLGFVSRLHAKDNQNHFVLGQQLYRPEEFAKQIELKTDNAWGIVSSVCDMLMKLPESQEDRYLMVKDPNKQLLNFYRVPKDAFEGEVEDDAADNQVRDEDHDSDFDA